MLSGRENPPSPLRPVQVTNANNNERCTSTPATWLMPIDAVADAGSSPARCRVRTPSAIPPVPAGVMLDVKDDAMRERNAGANGNGSATDPTKETAAKK